MNPHHRREGCLALVVILMTFFAPSASAQDLRRTPIVEAVARVAPAVVSIKTESLVSRRTPWDSIFQRHENTRNQRYRKASLGSGVIIDPKGYVITNEHVISRGSRIWVVLGDKTELQARIVGRDSDNDIAVLKVESKKPLPVAPLARSDDLILGEPTIALGNPFGLGGSITDGILSATRRSIEFQGREVFADFLQTSAVINPGNSGGPLLNIYGKVIGINVAIHSRGPGIGFAIPIKRVRDVLHKILDPRITRRAWFGLDVAHDNEADAATITGIDKDGPAKKAGLAKGDQIVALNDQPVSSWIDFYTDIDNLRPLSKVKLRLRRRGEIVNASLDIVAPPAARGDDSLFDLTGFAFNDIPKHVRRVLGDVDGVHVTRVKTRSSAERIGLKAGDVIYNIGGYQLKSAEHARRIMTFLREQDSMSVRLVRNGGRFRGLIAFEGK